MFLYPDLTFIILAFSKAYIYFREIQKQLKDEITSLKEEYPKFNPLLVIVQVISINDFFF